MVGFTNQLLRRAHSPKTQGTLKPPLPGHALGVPASPPLTPALRRENYLRFPREGRSTPSARKLILSPKDRSQLSARIGGRIRELRKQRGLTQGNIEARTGLMRCHISMIENGQKLPTLETLERFAKALDVPLYWLFHPGEVAVSTPVRNADEKPQPPGEGEEQSGSSGRFVLKLKALYNQMGELEREILLATMVQLAARAEARQKPASTSVADDIVAPTNGARSSGEGSDGELLRMSAVPDISGANYDINTTVIRCLESRLRTAATFAGLALASSDPEGTARNRRHARAAYEKVAHYLPRLTLTPEQLGEIDKNLKRLRSDLERLGESF